MAKSNVQAKPRRAKAAHKYEIAESITRPTVAGRHFHFVGAGGIGMSGLAHILLANNAVVTGSDQAATSVTESLSRAGARIEIGHRAEHVTAALDAVVISAAISDDNPELKKARELGRTVHKYAEMLGTLMDCYDGIAVSGTHGKSTTTGWLAYCLRRCGIDAGFLVGAEVPQLGCSAASGAAEYFVAEACEYDRSFHHLRPKIACILNVDRDHLDCYRDEDEIIDAFACFADGLKPGGLLVANGPDRNVARVIDRLRPDCLCETFGLTADCDCHADNVRLDDGYPVFDVIYHGELLGRTRISLAGMHNVQNALAVITVAVNLAVPAQDVLNCLSGFTGVDRRLMPKGVHSDITILDDYAHHPTEIQVTLRAIRQRYRPGRLWCVFQPHQYSRTRFLLDDFAGSFKLADVVIVPEIYFVRDSLESMNEVNSQVLAERIQADGTKAHSIGQFSQICDHLLERVAPGDLVVTMGAGDVWKVADEYIQRLRADSPERPPAG